MSENATPKASLVTSGIKSKSASSAQPNGVPASSPMGSTKSGRPPTASSIRKSVSENNFSSVAHSHNQRHHSAATTEVPLGTAQWSHVGFHRTTIPPAATFDEDNRQIKQDLLRMIVQYLQHEGFSMSSATIQDEANVKLIEKQQDKDALRRMTKAIHEGDWDLVAKLINKHLKKFHSQQGFLYAVCKQEYLELINRQEYQKAFTFLTTHLKPLEKISTMTNRNEFKDLCYLLTCKSVGEVDAFRDWEGVARSREKLVEQLRSTFELDEWVSAAGASAAMNDTTNTTNTINTNTTTTTTTTTTASVDRLMESIPDNRLLHLLHQSVAYQMEFSRYHPKTVPKVTSLLQDFECEVLPNCVKSTYLGHAQNVKYVTFVGQDGEFFASGSSDASIRLWPVEFPATEPPSSTPVTTIGEICKPWSRELKGHSSRIWYMTTNTVGDRLYSASGDGTVKIWDIRHALTDLSEEMQRYVDDDDDPEEDRRSTTSRFSLTNAPPTASHSDPSDAVSMSTNATASDCVATLGAGVGPFYGGGDIYSVNLHPSESHLVTGGYDQTVRLYDIPTGANVKTFRGHVASVCDAQFNRHANLIVSGSKDGTIRLWDILSGLCVHTLRQTLGEVTSISLASNGFLLLSGSRNNSNRLWDMRMLSAPRATLATSHSTSNFHGAGSGSASTSGLPMANGSLRNLNLPSLEHRPIQRFKGHQNTAKNVVRASFGPREAFVLGGSEDGTVCVWDVATGKLLEKLTGHAGVTYNARWHERQALMASSSHDGTVKTWWWQDKKR